MRTTATKYLFDFECEKCDSAAFLTPNREQTSCSRCDSTDPNFKEVSATGECVCKTGYRAIEVNKLGKPIKDNGGLNMIKCEECPANEYQGPATRSIWDCVSCPDRIMEYDSRSQCSCPAGYLKAGDGCISLDEYNQL